MPHFIVVEGIDGSGTSTQSEAICRALVAGGEKAVATAEPTKGPIGRMIREIIAGRLAPPVDNRALRRMLAYLYAADRQDHLENTRTGIRPMLAAGAHVVCCRYVLSSLAYESGDLEETAFIRTLNEAFPTPDLTIYLDCPVDVSVTRLEATRANLDIFENKSELERIHANYRALIEDYPGAIVTLDATQPLETVTEQAMAALEQLTD